MSDEIKCQEWSIGFGVFVFLVNAVGLSICSALAAISATVAPSAWAQAGSILVSVFTGMLAGALMVFYYYSED